MFVPQGGHWDRYFDKDGDVTKIRRIDLSPAELEQEFAVWRMHVRWAGTWPALVIAITSAATAGVLLCAKLLLAGGFAAVVFLMATILLAKKLRTNTALSNRLLTTIGLEPVSKSTLP